MRHNHKNFAAIDAIKGISILFIIISHSFWHQSWRGLQNLTIRNAVPLFFISIGFLFYLKFFKKIDYFKYIRSKIYRLLIPYYLLIPAIFLLSPYTPIDFILSPALLWLTGLPMQIAFGGYFIACYIQWMVIFLIAHRFIQKKITLIIYCITIIAANVLFLHFKQETLSFINIKHNSGLHQQLVIQHLPFISTGILIAILVESKLGQLILNNRNFFLTAFLTACLLIIAGPKFDPRIEWNFQESLSMDKIAILYRGLLYDSCLFLFLFSLFNLENNLLASTLQRLGKGSYEIFLTQAIFFWGFPSNTFHLKKESFQWFLFSLFAILVLSHSFRVLCHKVNSLLLDESKD